MLLDKNNIESAIVSYTLDGFSMTAKVWTYDNKATIFVLDKDAKYNQDFYYVLKGGSPDAGMSVESMNAEIFSNPFDAYNKFQDLLNEQDSQTPPPPPPPEDQKIPIILKTKKTNEFEVREVNGLMEVGSDVLGNGFIKEDNKINLKSEDVFETQIFVAGESMEAILIKAPQLDTNGKDAYFLIPKQPQPPEPQTILLKNPTTNEVQLREVNESGVVGTQNMGNGFIVDPTLINLASEDTFTTQLYVGGQPMDVTLVRNASMDTNGMDAYVMSQAPPPPPPPPKQTIVLKNPTTNEVQLREVDENGVVESQNMGNAFIVQPMRMDLASEQNFTTQLYFAGQPMDVTLVRNPSMDTDGMDAYMMSETPPPEEKNVILKNPLTNEVQIREVDDNNVVSNQIKANGFLLVPNRVNLSSDPTFQTQLYVNGQPSDVELVRTPSFDTDGMDAYLISATPPPEEKNVILKNPLSNQVQIREVDDNNVVSNQIKANGFIVQNGVTRLASADEFDTQLYINSQPNDVKLVRTPSLDTDGMDAYLIVSDKKTSIILKNPANNEVEIREVDEDGNVTNQILGNGFIVQPMRIPLVSEDEFDTQLYINGQSNDVKLIKASSFDTDGLDAYLVKGDGEPKEKKRTILLKDKTTNEGQFRELKKDGEIGDDILAQAFITQPNRMNLASEDRFETQLYVQGETLEAVLIKKTLYDKDGRDGYIVMIEGDDVDPNDDNDGPPPLIEQEIQTDRVRIVSEVSGIDQSIVKNNFRNVNLAVNFLSGINFKELQARLNTDKTAYQLAQEVALEIRNS